MEKLLDFEDRFPKTGEPTAQLVAFPNSRGGLSIEKRAFAESASPLYDFLKTVSPEPGCSFILVNALGAYEYYDDNRNGDGFPAQPYKVGHLAACGHAECSKGMDGWVSEPETLIHHYPSFEKFGGIYKHHVNKDPSKSLGYINKAVWNSHMRRVELLLKVVNARDPELAKRIGDGDFPAVSMGCHVRWDVCTICGHRAPTRAQYCEHARMSLRKVLPDGRKVAVLNPSPKFFDISFVFRPADPTGWMLKKVAEAGEPFRSSAEAGEVVDAHTQRVYEVRSLQQKIAAEMDAPYGTVVTETVLAWPRMGSAEKEVLASMGGRAAVASLAALGVPLGHGEFIELFAKCAGLSPTPHEIDRLVAAGPVLTEILTEYPDIGQKLGALIALSVDAVKIGPLRKIATWIEKRGGLTDVLRQVASDPESGSLPFGPGAATRAYEPARTDLLTMTNPDTGEQYQTTRGAAMSAHREDEKGTLIGTALLGSLYAGGINRALGDRLGPWSLPLGGLAGYYTTKKIKETGLRNPYYITDQGIPVPGNTEFVKVSAFQHPTASDALCKVAYDNVERAGSPAYGALLRKIADEGGAGYASWLAKTPMTQKVAELVRGAERSSPDSLIPSLDLTTLISNIARRVWW